MSTVETPERAAAPRATESRSRELVPPASFLTGVRLVACREISAYFDSLIAYVYTIAFVIITNFLFMNDFFLVGKVDMTAFFTPTLPWLLAFFLPAVTMRLWAEERKQRTVELLLTLPIAPMQAILGKYLAALALFGLVVAGSLPIVVMLFAVGSPDLGLIASSYLGLVLFGAMFLALGSFFSALTGDQIVAFVASSLVGCFFVATGNDAWMARIDGFAEGLAPGTLLYESVSAIPHYEAFVHGVVGLPSLVYFGLMSGLFLWATALVLERHRG